MQSGSRIQHKFSGLLKAVVWQAGSLSTTDNRAEHHASCITQLELTGSCDFQLACGPQLSPTCRPGLCTTSTNNVKPAFWQFLQSHQTVLSVELLSECSAVRFLTRNRLHTRLKPKFFQEVCVLLRTDIENVSTARVLRCAARDTSRPQAKIRNLCRAQRIEKYFSADA